ncbi:MAG: enoyl-CoA hydratase [Flavobacteriales bacterium]|nr:enoyl-CoA hydratase [Flavobacteriales bacterium]|tara:strand:- start:127 stop:900 length:774 start_codon:yes stop_codon:yes gene_type:complete
MIFQNLEVNYKDKIAVVTINRPENLNALNSHTISELHDCFLALESNPDVRSIVLTGAGNKAFVAGADIKEFAHFSMEEGKALAREGQEKLFNTIEQLNTPVIAAISGFALGGGLELAMACHIRIAGNNAKMGLPEVTLGLIPGYGGTQRLAQLVGRGRAMEMILSANFIDGKQAYVYGLINNVVSDQTLLMEALKLALKISKNSPNAVKAAIKAMNAGYDKNKNGFEVEVSEFGKCFGTEDFKEGVEAFLNKRKPEF